MQRPHPAGAPPAGRGRLRPSSAFGVFHPLVVSLANTQEPLFLVNRSGNRPSNEGASARLDQAIELCRQAGFKKVTLREEIRTSRRRSIWIDGMSKE